MRIAATIAIALFALAACSTSSTTQSTESPFTQPNSLMSGEISQRVEQIPFQHREELVQNLIWLTEAGEQVIPSVLNGLRHENPKVRSSCAWVLGRLRDRRTIPALRAAAPDREVSVRCEIARSLVLLGDLQACPTLIEGLDNDRPEVRYMCHEALKTATGHDFGYDHLNQNQREAKVSVLRWRQWWGEYSGDRLFAQNYQDKNGLGDVPAMPAGETAPTPNPTPDAPSEPLVPSGNGGTAPTTPGTAPQTPGNGDR